MIFRAACLQLNSNNHPKENLKVVLRESKKAVAKKANIILTPENTFLFSSNHQELLNKSQPFHKNFCIEQIKKFSKQNKVWFLIGATPIKIKKRTLVNRSILIGSDGKIKSYYDKIHMFDVTLSKKEKYQESKKFLAGSRSVVAKLPWGKLGLTICYDLRFPNLYRKLTKQGSVFLSVPSAFTKNTGSRHWHALLRSRAIENFSYVFAPAQTGTHHNKRETYGHSLIISPDGKILSEKKSGVGHIITKIDINEVHQLRKQIPSLKND